MGYQDTFKKSGVNFKKIKETDRAVCYECKLYESIWWEVWQKRRSKERVVILGDKEVTYRGGLVYPRNEEFGRYAYTVARRGDIDQTLDRFPLHGSMKEVSE